MTKVYITYFALFLASSKPSVSVSYNNFIPLSMLSDFRGNKESLLLNRSLAFIFFFSLRVALLPEARDFIKRIARKGKLDFIKINKYKMSITDELSV